VGRGARPTSWRTPSGTARIRLQSGENSGEKFDRAARIPAHIGRRCGAGSDRVGGFVRAREGFAVFRHRTGHGIGLEGHESPWIAEGDKTVLREGMTFSCEPGVYDPDFGEFRHSDTVMVRKDRGEILNHYPTRLGDMVIEI